MNEERSYKTDAIVLRRYEMGESDYRVLLYTPNYGKISAVSKGGRKPLGRQTGQVELYARTRLLIHKGRELDTISQAEMQEPHTPLREDLDRHYYANLFSELLDQFAPEGEQNPDAYWLLLDSFEWLCHPETNLKLAARYYEYQILRVMGFEPSVIYCAVSGEKLEPADQYFSVAEGGMVAPQHTAGLNLIQVSLPVFKVLRHFHRHKWDTIKNLQLTDAQHHEIERLMYAYLVYLLERHLKSVKLIRKRYQQTQS